MKALTGLGIFFCVLFLLVGLPQIITWSSTASTIPSVGGVIGNIPYAWLVAIVFFSILLVASAVFYILRPTNR